VRIAEIEVIADNKGGNPTSATVLAWAIIECSARRILRSCSPIKLEDHNALLDEIESFAGRDSVDVKLLVELVKHKRPRAKAAHRARRASPSRA
jgi:hypothetical protein